MLFYNTLFAAMTLMFYSIILLCIGIAFASNYDFEEKRMNRVAQMVKTLDVECLPYGVYLKKVAKLDLSSSTWRHVFRIPHLPPPPVRQIKQLCQDIPSVERLIHFYEKTYSTKIGVASKAKLRQAKKSFCGSLSALTDTYSHLLNYTQDKNLELHENLDLMTLNRVDNHKPFQGGWHLSKDAPKSYIATPDNYWQTPSDSITKNTVHSRDKRGLLNIVGKGLKGLFGLSTEQDYDELKQFVNAHSYGLEYLNSKFSAFEGEMRSVLDVHWDRMEFITDVMNKTLHSVHALKTLQRQSDIRWNVKHSMDIVYMHVILEAIGEMVIAHQALMEYQGVMRDRVLTMTRLNQGYLSPELVTVQLIQEAIDGVQPVLHTQYVPFQFAFDDNNYFYSVPLTTYVSDNEYLYIQIQIPLSVLVSNYHVYEVLSVPIKASTSNTHYTQLTNLPTYVGFSEAGDTYTTFNGQFLASCMGHGVKRCPSRVAEISTTVPSCILGLFLQDIEMANTYCTTDLIIAASLAEQILDIGQGQFFLSANATGDSWVLHCPDSRPRVTQPCSSCVVTLGCRCSLKTTSAFISASLQNCNTESASTGIHKAYIPNLIWLSRLSDFSNFEEVSYNMTTSLLDDPALDIPDLPFPTYDDIREFTDKNAMIKTSLDRVLSAASQNKPVYVSKMQEYSEKTRWLFFKYQHALPLALFALVWLAVLTAILAIGGKYLCFLLVALRQFDKTDAASIGADQQTVALSTPFKVCLWYMTVTLTLCAVGQAIRFVLIYRRHLLENRKCYPLKGDEPVTTKIYLKLWTPFRLVTLFIDELVVPNSELVVRPNKPNTLSVKLRYRAWKTTLTVCWAGIKLRHTGGLIIPLPEFVKVPRDLSHLVSKIISENKYQASLIFRTGPLQTEHMFNTEPFPTNERPGIRLNPKPIRYKPSRLPIRKRVPPSGKPRSIRPPHARFNHSRIPHPPPLPHFAHSEWFPNPIYPAASPSSPTDSAQNFEGPPAKKFKFATDDLEDDDLNADIRALFNRFRETEEGENKLEKID